MKDEYHRAHLQHLEDMKKDHALMKEAPFKSMVYGNKPFNPEKLVFGEK